MSCPIFDINYFDQDQARAFVLAALDRLATTEKYRHLSASLKAHRKVYASAADSLVAGLESVAAEDGAKFSGYAPVLEAVATALAEVANPGTINDEVQASLEGAVLETLADRILVREAHKLRDQLPANIPSETKEKLYLKEEQLARLASVVYQMPAPPLPMFLSQEFASAYGIAINGLLPNHPFLDGRGRQPSGAVFSAVINAHALFGSDPAVAAIAVQHAGSGPHTPNPFLIDFYLKAARDKSAARTSEELIVSPEHIVALYESVRSRVPAGAISRLNISGAEDSDLADVEITIEDMTGPPRVIAFQTSQAGVLYFGRGIGNVFVDAPDMDVKIGSGNSIELRAPISLNIARLEFNCPELVVSRREQDASLDDNAVVIEARELSRSNITGVPTVRKGVELFVAWPNSHQHPWNVYPLVQSHADDQDLGFMRRRLRKILTAFRRDKKAGFVRYAPKIQHLRMTKGERGGYLVDCLVRDQVLSLFDGGKYYRLDPVVMGRLLGMDWNTLMKYRFTDQCDDYLRSIAAEFRATQ